MTGERSTQLWLPVIFDPKTGIAQMRYVEQWDPRAEQKYRVGKLTLGYVYDLPRNGHLKLGVGGLASRYRLPGELTPVYGNPTSFMLFARAKLI